MLSRACKFGWSRNDWVCSNCKMVNYGENNRIICICGQTKWGSKTFLKGKYTWRIGDKLCSNCNEWNFKKNIKCKQCQSQL